MSEKDVWGFAQARQTQTQTQTQTPLKPGQLKSVPASAAYGFTAALLTCLIVGVLSIIVVLVAKPRVLCLRGGTEIHPPYAGILVISMMAIAGILPFQVWWAHMQQK